MRTLLALAALGLLFVGARGVCRSCFFKNSGCLHQLQHAPPPFGKPEVTLSLQCVKCGLRVENVGDLPVRWSGVVTYYLLDEAEAFPGNPKYAIRPAAGGAAIEIATVAESASADRLEGNPVEVTMDRSVSFFHSGRAGSLSGSTDFIHPEAHSGQPESFHESLDCSPPR